MSSSDEAAPSSDAAAELSLNVGRNLHRLRVRRGLSHEQLAAATGVGRDVLVQIEQGKGAPTIGLLWKIATALDITFATLTSASAVGGTALLRRANSKVLASADGGFTSRALFPYEGGRQVEFYELTVAPGQQELADPHTPGTSENLVVVTGELEVFDGVERHLLGPGDALIFEADMAHAYRNPGEHVCVAYLVMIYAETGG